jgi:hypothetical protein
LRNSEKITYTVEREEKGKVKKVILKAKVQKEKSQKRFYFKQMDNTSVRNKSVYLTLGHFVQPNKIDNITFYFPKTHTFNLALANKLFKAIDSLTSQWKLKKIPINYYFADTFEELQHLRGLDYSIGMGNKDKPSGMADKETNTVFAGGLGEYYFHEAVHLYLNPLFPKSPLLEGLAVFYGGSLGQDLKWHLSRLNNYLNQHPEIDLNDFENFWYMDNFTNPTNTIQGLLCFMAYKNGGLEKLKKLMSYDDIYVAIEKEFEIKKEGLNSFFRSQIKLNSAY